jgi:hypothetical protein
LAYLFSNLPIPVQQAISQQAILRTTSHFITSHFTTSHFTTSHFTTSHFTTSYFTTSHFTTSQAISQLIERFVKPLHILMNQSRTNGAILGSGHYLCGGGW